MKQVKKPTMKKLHAEVVATLKVINLTGDTETSVTRDCVYVEGEWSLRVLKKAFEKAPNFVFDKNNLEFVDAKKKVVFKLYGAATSKSNPNNFGTFMLEANNA